MYAVIAEPALYIHNWVSKTENQSIKLLPSRVVKQNHGYGLEPHLWKNNAFATNLRRISLRLKSPLVIGPYRKSLRLCAFKSNEQNDDCGSKSSASKSLKKSVGLSYAPRESESISVESLKAHSVVPAYPSDTESTASSLAIFNLFKSWLTLLRVPSSGRQPVDETLEETTREGSGTWHLSHHNEKTRILKAVWCYFMNLNATVKIPMLIFIPSYIAVKLIYGSEVAKELYPLWIMGPLICAVYVRLLRSICALYILSFNQSIKIIKSIPDFYQVSYNYVFNGLLKEHIRRSSIQPLVDIKNMDFKDSFKKTVKILNSWVVEKYLDFVESIWPFYCRTIRFLKRAHLI